MEGGREGGKKGIIEYTSDKTWSVFPTFISQAFLCPEEPGLPDQGGATFLVNFQSVCRQGT